MESQELQGKVNTLTQALKESEENQAATRKRFIELSEKYDEERREYARRIDEYEDERAERDHRIATLERFMKLLEVKMETAPISAQPQSAESSAKEIKTPTVPLLQVPLDQSSASSPTVPLLKVPLTESSVSSPTVPFLKVPIDHPSVAEQVKVQVEHLVRADTSLTASKIRAFSGTSPKPGEVVFDEWWRQAESLLQDDHMSEVVKKQKLMSSLRSPALDLVKGMGEISSAEICKQLEDMYGCSSSGAKLLQEFFQMKRAVSESAADYLQRLSMHMSKVSKKGGLTDNIDETLLAHFISTCGSEHLRQTLHVKYESGAPSQHNLLKEVRKAEEVFGLKGAERVKTIKVNSQTLSKSDDMASVKKQLSMMQSKLEQMDMKIKSSPQNAQPQSMFQGHQQRHQQPRYSQHYSAESRQFQRRQRNERYQRRFHVFCYKCGMDGHFKSECKNAPNQQLVYKQLNEREQRPGHLNGNGSQ